MANESGNIYGWPTRAHFIPLVGWNDTTSDAAFSGALDLIENQTDLRSVMGIFSHQVSVLHCDNQTLVI
jgi:hypothetical protein